MTILTTIRPYSVVDDDARIRQMLTRYFEQEGYRISAAADGFRCARASPRTA